MDVESWAHRESPKLNAKMNRVTFFTEIRIWLFNVNLGKKV